MRPTKEVVVRKYMDGMEYKEVVGAAVTLIAKERLKDKIDNIIIEYKSSASFAEVIDVVAKWMADKQVSSQVIVIEDDKNGLQARLDVELENLKKVKSTTKY